MTLQKNNCPAEKPAGKTFFLLFLAMLALFAVMGCSKKEEVVKEEVVRPAKIMTIENAESTRNFKFPGKVQALDRVELSFEVSGKLVEVAIKEGQRVSRGDVIAKLDPSNYQSQLDARQAQVNQTKAEVDRYANLLEEKVVAKSTFDVKQRNYEVAISDLQIARKALSDTILRASFGGIIGKRFIDNFQVVQAKEPIVSLQRLSAIEVVVNIPENVMRREDTGSASKIDVEFANYPGERFPLKIKEYAVEADSQTQTFRVILTMPMPKDKTVLDGMTATVFLQVMDTTKSGVEIPVQSIFYDEKEQAYVWKVGQDFHITRHPVTVGSMTNAGDIVIKTGLATEDRVITSGVQTLTEGLKVREFTGTMGE
ncbi:efflux RND transporter periplasmic adaptor subunit [bacterium]|nr:efflux RND transporter periplasmic adaptor subunit [bacterium]